MVLPNDLKPSVKPTAREILAQVEDIARIRKISGQCFKILRYIVNEELGGKGELIKQWSIAVYALGRPKNFYPKDSSIIRTQVANLRRELSAYYMNAGRCDPVKIEVPRGSYRPTFSYPDPEDHFSATDRTIRWSVQAAYDKQTIAAYATALNDLNDVLLKHPDYPLALSLKADIHCSRAIHGLVPMPELEEAKALAERAIEICPEAWEAHNAHGAILAAFRKWPEAHQAFELAKARKPHDVPVHPSYTAFLVSQGHTDEAIRLMRSAVDHRNGGATARGDLGILQILGGVLDEAKATLESNIRDFPDFYLSYVYLAILYEALDHPRNAAEIMDRAPLDQEQRAITIGLTALFHGLAGNTRRAQLELDTLLAASTKGLYVRASQLAVCYLGLGEHHSALDWLRSMADQCDPLVHWLGHFPFLRHLANLSEFHGFLTTLGLSWRWQRRTIA